MPWQQQMLLLRLQSLSQVQDMDSIRGTLHLVDMGQGLLEGGVSPETIVTTCPTPRQAVHACAPDGDLAVLAWGLWSYAYFGCYGSWHDPCMTF